jgi:hypothetical protein
VALGAREAREISDTQIRIRGEAEKLGPVVPRGFLTVLSLPDQPAIASHQSGRLELARWLTSEQNPLTPRVFVNRVWQRLFGQGLVTSVDNFGVTGDRPSHPELLDYLATRFIRDAWSTKKLVRTIVLSRAYGLDSAQAHDPHVADPANRLLWRHALRRLDAEELRDATLLVAGNLDRSVPRGSPVSQLPVIEVQNNGPDARRLADEALAARHRSVYLPLLRGLVPRSLDVFDFAEQGMVTGRRDTTTVATQALYVLNDPFVRRQSLMLAGRLLAHVATDDAQRIDWAYRLTMGRAASAREIERVLQYLGDYEHEATMPDDTVQPKNPREAAWASFCQALLGSAEFRYLP